MTNKKLLFLATTMAMYDDVGYVRRRGLCMTTTRANDGNV
jgi:hypothetical protein